MVKIVYNRYGSEFRLGKKVETRYKELTGRSMPLDLRRDDIFLVQAVEDLGELGGGFNNRLMIAEVPEGKRYAILERFGGNTVVLEEEFAWETAEATKPTSRISDLVQSFTPTCLFPELPIRTAEKPPNLHEN